MIPSQTANSVHVMKMCQAMAQEGHEVMLFGASANSQAIGMDDIFAHYGVSTHFQLKLRQLSPLWRTWDFAFAAVSEARTHRVDLIYTRHIPSAFLSTRAGIPTTLEIHDVPCGKIGLRLFQSMLQRGKLFRLVVLTDALERIISDRWPKVMEQTDVVVAHDAVDLERYNNLLSPSDARRMLSLPNGFTAGYVGSLYKGRGIEFIIELAQRCPDVSFHVVGGPNELAGQRKKQISERDLSNVEFEGYISNRDVPIHLAACEILLMPYQSVITVSGGSGDTAGVCSPLKMFEYLAAGRMVISSDIPVFREVVDDSCMVLLAPDDIDAWLAAIARAKKDASWRLGYADAGRTLVQSHTWRARVRKCLGDVSSHDSN